MDPFKPADDISIQSSTQETTPQSFAQDTGGQADASARKPRELRIGQIVDGRYRVISLLGRGGIGSVYRVEQIMLKREFALKTLNPIVISDVTVRRLQKEAQAASRLDHPNIVRAVDCGIIDGDQPFLVMDIAEGQTLAGYLKKRGRLSIEETLEIFIPICRAVAYAHQERVIHRDIKPSNIVLVESESGKLTPKVVDFGIAKLEVEDEEGGQALTRTGEIFGTPLYMSPEQCNAGKVDAKSDIYSLGCVLFECLTGTPPYRGETALNTMMQHSNEDKPPTLKEATLGMDYPVSMEKVVATMLAKDPEARYQSCDDVLHHLIWIRDGHEERFKSSTTSRADPGHKPSTRNTAIIAASILSLTVLAFSGAKLLSPPEVKQTLAPEIKHPINFSTESSLEYFSTVDGNRKKFRFSTGVRIGRLLWLDENDKYHEQAAMGSVTVPVGRPLLFDVGYDLFVNPVMMRNFRRDELTTVVLRAPDIVTDEDLNDLLADVLALRSLRELVVTRTQMSAENKSSLADLSHLRMLSLDRTNFQAQDLVNLKSLRTLTSLFVGDLDDPTPVLKKLIKGSSLKRLGLGKNLERADFELISQLKNLTILSTACQNRVLGDWTSSVKHLGKMKQLELLGISDCLIRDAAGKLSPPAMSELRKLTNLRGLAVDGSVLSAEEAAQLKKYVPPGCTLLINDGKQLAGGLHLIWFEPELRNPFKATLPDSDVRDLTKLNPRGAK